MDLTKYRYPVISELVDGFVYEVYADGVPWGFTHVVRITKATLNVVNQLQEFKKDQLVRIK